MQIKRREKKNLKNALRGGVLKIVICGGEKEKRKIKVRSKGFIFGFPDCFLSTREGGRNGGRTFIPIIWGKIRIGINGITIVWWNSVDVGQELSVRVSVIVATEASAATTAATTVIATPVHWLVSVAHLEEIITTTAAHWWSTPMATHTAIHSTAIVSVVVSLWMCQLNVALFATDHLFW